MYYVIIPTILSETECYKGGSHIILKSQSEKATMYSFIKFVNLNRMSFLKWLPCQKPLKENKWQSKYILCKYSKDSVRYGVRLG